RSTITTLERPRDRTHIQSRTSQLWIDFRGSVVLECELRVYRIRKPVAEAATPIDVPDRVDTSTAANGPAGRRPMFYSQNEASETLRSATIRRCVQTARVEVDARGFGRPETNPSANDIGANSVARL